MKMSFWSGRPSEENIFAPCSGLVIVYLIPLTHFEGSLQENRCSLLTPVKDGYS